MLRHFLGLIAQALEKMPALVGSNWGGLLFSALVFAITQAVFALLGDVRKHWQRNTIIGFIVTVIAWVGLFTVSMVLSVYDDHQNMVGASRRIRQALQREIQNEKADLTQKIDDEQSKLVGSEVSRAIQQGRYETLEKQSRDQQNLIAGCQAQALKLLSPEENWKPVAFEAEHGVHGHSRSRWLLFENKTIPTTEWL